MPGRQVGGLKMYSGDQSVADGGVVGRPVTGQSSTLRYAIWTSGSQRVRSAPAPRSTRCSRRPQSDYLV